MKRSNRHSGAFLRLALFCLGWIAVILLPAGCRDQARPASFQEALRYLDQDQPELAMAAFEQSILDGKHVFEAHMQLGLLSEQMPDRRILAVWHFRQCLQKEPSNQHQMAIKEWLGRNEKMLLAELKNKLETTGEEEKKQRTKFLEEHALRQKEWISELAQENRELRLRLAEMQMGKNKK